MVTALMERLKHLVDVGLGYLTLHRETATLSGGESQRVKMVRHLGSSLTDITYIFDEPSIGLHSHDIDRLKTLIKQLRDKGNTILIVEHDPEMIVLADHIIDIGPGAGAQGGKVTYQGDFAGLKEADTVTGRYLSRLPRIKLEPRSPKGWLHVEHACMHNVQEVSVHIPCGVMTVVTGVAGSGKSTLINRVLPQQYPEIMHIDQSELRGSKRSNPATYIGVFDTIRELFAQANNVSSSLFSFNSSGRALYVRDLVGLILIWHFWTPL